MSKKTPGSKYAMKQGRARYLEERARYRAKRDRRLAEAATNVANPDIPTREVDKTDENATSVEETK